MRHIILVLFIIATVVSCEKEDDIKVDKWNSAMRAVKIEGCNEIWGDFVFKFYYGNKTGKIDSAFRYDNSGRKRGSISFTNEKGVSAYNINDYIDAIDPDSIIRLDNILKGKWGEGNYSLIDSIPKVSRALMVVKTTLFNGVIETQEFSYYKPREDVGTGKNFNNNYILTKKEKNIYEYDDSGNILNCRSFVDIYTDPKKPTIYTREIFKSEYIFDKNIILDNVIYTSDIGNEYNWKQINSKKYTYGGEYITSIVGHSYDLSATYSGEKLTAITENGVTTKYSMNDNGFVTRIEKGANDFMNIVYESGHGELMILSKLDQEQRGFPIIK